MKISKAGSSIKFELDPVENTFIVSDDVSLNMLKDEIKSRWLETISLAFDKCVEQVAFNYFSNRLEVKNNDSYYGTSMSEVKPVKVDMTDKEIQELKDLLKKSPVTLLPNNGFNDKAQGWYHVDAEDGRLGLGISIHKRLWLDRLHTGSGTSAFSDENGKVWIIPTKSIRFLHPYKEKK